jgi:hypothetical protein
MSWIVEEKKWAKNVPERKKKFLDFDSILVLFTG